MSESNTDLYHRLGIMEGKMDQMLELRSDLVGMGGRVTKLETWRTFLAGGATVIGVLIAYIFKVLPFLGF